MYVILVAKRRLRKKEKTAENTLQCYCVWIYTIFQVVELPLRRTPLDSIPSSFTDGRREFVRRGRKRNWKEKGSRTRAFCRTRASWNVEFLGHLTSGKNVCGYDTDDLSYMRIQIVAKNHVRNHRASWTLRFGGGQFSDTFLRDAISISNSDGSSPEIRTCMQITVLIARSQPDKVATAKRSIKRQKGKQSPGLFFGKSELFIVCWNVECDFCNTVYNTKQGRSSCPLGLRESPAKQQQEQQPQQQHVVSNTCQRRAAEKPAGWIRALCVHAACARSRMRARVLCPSETKRRQRGRGAPDECARAVRARERDRERGDSLPAVYFKRARILSVASALEARGSVAVLESAFSPFFNPFPHTHESS